MSDMRERTANLSVRPPFAQQEVLVQGHRLIFRLQTPP